MNTGNGWATWNANGDFVTYYIADSRAAGIMPVFTYYQIVPVEPRRRRRASPMALSPT